MLDPNKLYAKLSEAGEEWADKDAAANLLEETRKSVLANLMSDFIGTNAERERMALATHEYKEHITLMVEARREANKARARYDSIKIYTELVRTVESTRRAEMQIR